MTLVASIIKDIISILKVLSDYAKISKGHPFNRIIKFHYAWFFSWNSRSSSSKAILSFPKNVFQKALLFSQRLFAFFYLFILSYMKTIFLDMNKSGCHFSFCNSETVFLPFYLIYMFSYNETIADNMLSVEEVERRF